MSSVASFNRKRDREDSGDAPGAASPSKRKRRSRFSDAPAGAPGIAAAPAPPAGLPAPAGPRVEAGVGMDAMEKARRAAEIQRQIQEQLMSVSRALGGQGMPGGRATFIPPPLLLNERGEQIDEQGNVVKPATAPVASLKANQRAIKQATNPYLAHLEPKPDAAGRAAAASAGTTAAAPVVDPRLHTVDRRQRGNRALRFVEQGRYTEEGEAMRAREARRAVYASLRVIKSRPQGEGEGAGAGAAGEAAATATTPGAAAAADAASSLPPAREEPVPAMEWWDAAFLPADQRTRAGTGPGADPTFRPSYSDVTVTNQKTASYVEHPVPILGVPEEPVEALPLMLTKKVRGRCRSVLAACACCLC